MTRILFLFLLSGLTLTAQTLVVAHRGLLLDSPENTLANYRACLQLRLGFEFDVQRSRDGHLVSIHDDLVDRTTNGKGRADAMTLAELRRLDAGRWFSPAFSGERIPTIDEVFALMSQHKQDRVMVAADLKGVNVEQDVVKLAEKHGVLDKVLFIGRAITLPEVRANIRKASAKAHIAKVANNAGEFDAALKASDADWVYFRYLPSQAEMTAVHKAGKHAFIAGATVADHQPDNWKQAIRVGMDAILTDYAPELGRLIRLMAAPPPSRK